MNTPDSASFEQPAKPPTQIAGVEGIAATPVTMNQPVIDWGFLLEFPPFQMYAEELQRPDRNAQGWSSRAHAEVFVRQRGSGQDLVDSYAEWHAVKGFWPNETPFGKVKDHA